MVYDGSPARSSFSAGGSVARIRFLLRHDRKSFPRRNPSRFPAASASALCRTRQSPFLAIVPACLLAASLTSCGSASPPLRGNLVASPSSLSFGSVDVGETAAATVSLGNNGSASIQVSKIQFSSPDFSLSAAVALPITLAVGQTYNLTVKFAPSAAGAASGSLTLATSDSSASLTVPLSGTGAVKATSPGLHLGSASVSFGDIQVGNTSAQSVTITSSGTAALTISAVTVAGTGFSASGLSLPVTLDPAQTAELVIDFAPDAAGAATGLVSLTTNASSDSATVALSGTGVTTAYEVDLTWDLPAPSSDPAVGYKIFRAVNNSDTYTLLNAAVDDSTSYTDTTVQNGNTYSYYVTSVDADGNQSAPSGIFAISIPD
jgi:hypothetical protein